MSQLSSPLVSMSRLVSATALGSGREDQTLACVEECPIAFRYNGFSHGVMMATPFDLEDFAVGFSLSEDIVDAAAEISAIAIEGCGDAMVIDISLGAASLHRYLARRRVRQLRGPSGCGLCGVEDLKDIVRPAAQVPLAAPPQAKAVLAAFEALRDWQPLSRATRGAHAAAWVAPEGAIQSVREDVGRHNALDKLIGAGLRGAFDKASGFCLVTSRCSFEMVQKAVAAGFSAIVSASAPTALAIRTAEAGGLVLCALSRERIPLIFTPHRICEVSSWHGHAK